MKRIISIFLFFVLAMSFISCSNDDKGPTENEEEISVLNRTDFFSYEKLGTAPLHDQTSMLTAHNNKLYRFVSRWSVQVLDLNTKTWSEIPLPDSSFWRWDGAAVTIGDDIFILAVSTSSGSYDILKFNTSSSQFEHTGVTLPQDFHYPAYCVQNQNIVFLTPGTGATYEFNTGNNVLSEVADNPFLYSVDINLTLSSGKYKNYLYVFGGYSDRPENIFYRLNLDDYKWEELDFPKEIKSLITFGGILDNQFILFTEVNKMYVYSFSEDQWYVDTTGIPIYPISGSGDFMNGEWSFYSGQNVLYGTENIADNVWKITK